MYCNIKAFYKFHAGVYSYNQWFHFQLSGDQMIFQTSKNIRFYKSFMAEGEEIELKAWAMHAFSFAK